MKNVLFRKYQISDESIQSINEYYTKTHSAERAVRERYPSIGTLDEEIRRKFNDERQEALETVEEPRELVLAVSETLIADVMPSLVKWEKSCKVFFNHYRSRRSGVDGVTYRIEVALGNLFNYEFTIWSPDRDSEEGKLVSDMISLTKSLERKIRVDDTGVDR